MNTLILLLALSFIVFSVWTAVGVVRRIAALRVKRSQIDGDRSDAWTFEQPKDRDVRSNDRWVIG